MIKAKYTLTLDEIISSGYTLKGLSDYVIFDDRYKTVLNSKIYHYYQNYEIAYETVEMFDNRLYAKMLDIMTYYNQFYEIEKLKNEIGFKDLLNKRYQETYNSDGTLDYINTLDGKVSHLGKDVTFFGGKVNRVPNLTTTATTTYNSTFTTNAHNTHEFENLGGKDTTESANLNADTPQNNSPISDNVGEDGFNTFNNDVFKINGYLSNADKNLTITELNSSSKNTDDIDNRYIRTGNDKTETRETGTDTTDTNNNTTVTYDSHNDTDNTTTHDQDTTQNYTKYGNSDYIKSLQDLIDNLNNIDNMICRDLRELFLYVY